MNDNNQVTADFAAFAAPPPGEVSELRKAKERQEAMLKADEKRLKPEQLKAAAKLTDEMKAESEAAEKAKLLQKLNDYMKLVKEFHPERAEFLKVPKNYGVKNTCEELRIYIHDIQTELGKKGGLDMVKMMWAEGFKVFEKLNEGERFGLNVRGLGEAAQMSLMSRKYPDGTVVVGPAVPTLAEFCCKHSTWFTTDVDVRVVLMAVEMVASVHRLNTKQDINVDKAANTPVSKQTEDLMKKL